ncbi:MAG TPA: FAD-dependent oxidoreductase [Dehalococcoidia bacterium]|nr:FAD-dependent oxidoreductase [Dehalococcoidia bacterium]
MRELIIIGGGPAGMTAAVYAARKRLDTLLISKDIGGQALWSASVENYMGYQYIEGFELMAKFEEQMKQFPLEQKIGEEVVALSRRNAGFEIRIANGESYQAKAVIVATGKRPRQLNVPGEERLKSRGVTYCAICDGPLFAGQKVAVIGGGNSALEAADDMVKIAEYVYLVSLTPFTGDRILINKVKEAPNMTVFLEHKVVAIDGESRVEAVAISDLKSGEEKRLEVGGVFVEIGLIPSSDLSKGIVRLNELGEIEINCATDTGVPGLFAAGDVTNAPEKQILVAAAEGAKAALQAHKYLKRL